MNNQDHRVWHECPLSYKWIYHYSLDPTHSKSLVKDYISKTLVELNKIQLCSNSTQKNCVICDYASKLELEYELNKKEKEKQLKQEHNKKLSSIIPNLDELKKFAKLCVNIELKNNSIKNGTKLSKPVVIGKGRKKKNCNQLEISFEYQESEKKNLDAENFEEDLSDLE